MTKNSPPQIISPECETLTGLIAQLREKESLDLLQTLRESGHDTFELLACCMEGVKRVGLRYEKGEYFISALIMAGEIMRQASEYLTTFLPANRETGLVSGHILLGTVKGDIHDLGKNILKNMLLCNGFKVTDLGVDVPSQTFVDNTLFYDPDIIAISCLLTNCLDNLVETVKDVRTACAGKEKLVIVGGSCLDDLVNQEVRADHWFTDAIQGVNFCLERAISK